MARTNTLKVRAALRIPNSTITSGGKGGLKLFAKRVTRVCYGWGAVTHGLRVHDSRECTLVWGNELGAGSGKLDGCLCEMVRGLMRGSAEVQHDVLWYVCIVAR